jgi:AcrR family transcriptional regulator
VVAEPTTARDEDEPAPARRGRPPRYSREQIVRDVAEMLLAEPDEPLTIARAADAIGAAPMSLYRHFADREDLVVSVAHHLLAGARPPLDGATSWQDQLRAWMTTVHDQATRVPQLLQFAGTGPSPAWLTDSAYLSAVLERAGFDDDRSLAEAVYWVATTTMGQAMIHAASPPESPHGRLQNRLDDLPAADAERLGRVLPHLAAMHKQEFVRVVDWTIAGLERTLAERAPGSAPGAMPGGRGRRGRPIGASGEPG